MSAEEKYKKSWKHRQMGSCICSGMTDKYVWECAHCALCAHCTHYGGALIALIVVQVGLKKVFEVYVEISSKCESRLKYINSNCSSRGQNPKRFWKFFKTKTKVSNIQEKVSMKVNNMHWKKFANNAVEIANTFNTYFASIFTHDNKNIRKLTLNWKT
jgi:hypothetical protein